MLLEDIENPDETDEDKEDEEIPSSNRESPQKINSFFLRERKNDEKPIKE